MATGTVPSIRNFDSPLREYLAIREELGELEGRQAECTCDADEFHTCEICQDYAEKNHRAKSLIDLWGDNWAVELGKLRVGEAWRAIDRTMDQEIVRVERVLARDELSPCSYESPESRHGTWDGSNPCYKLATVNDLATGWAYCQDHSEEVCRD